MTTIAWDGTALAADRRGIADDVIVTASTKVFRTDAGYLCGGCGNTMQVNTWLRWMNAGGDRPAELSDKEEDICGLEIRPDKSIWFHGRFGAAQILVPFHAVGSGAQYAIGAMAAGASASEAILIASRFDWGTGNGVDTLTLTAD